VRADDTQTWEADAAERRRSLRILREITIRLDGDGRSCTALTAVINRHELSSRRGSGLAPRIL